MKNTVWVIIVVSVVAALVAMTGCAPAAPEEKPTVKLAHISQQSGAAMPLGQMMMAASDMAAAEINAAGGILGGRMVEIIQYDEGYGAEVVVSAVREAIAAGAVAITGISDASAAIPAAAVVKNAGIPLIIAYAGSMSTTNVPGYYKGSFHVGGGRPEKLVGSYALWADSLGGKRLATIMISSEWGQQVNSLLDEYEAAGTLENLERVYHTFYTWGEWDVGKEVTAAVREDPDVIYLQVYSAEALLPGVKRLKELGWDGLLMIGVTAMDVGTLAAEGGDLVDGVISATTFYPDPATPSSVEFTNRLVEFAKGKYATEIKAVGGHGVSSYVAVMMTALAFDKAGTTDDLDAFVEAMSTLDFDHPGGFKMELVPGGGGEFKTKSIFILTAKGGETVVVEKFPVPEPWEPLKPK